MFSLRYTVEEPLATVLTAAAEAAYQRVAGLLWALKRAEHSLGGAWLALNAMQRQLARLAARARRAGLACPGARRPAARAPNRARAPTCSHCKLLAATTAAPAHAERRRVASAQTDTLGRCTDPKLPAPG